MLVLNCLIIVAAQRWTLIGNRIRKTRANRLVDTPLERSYDALRSEQKERGRSGPPTLPKMPPTTASGPRMDSTSKGSTLIMNRIRGNGRNMSRDTSLGRCSNTLHTGQIKKGGSRAETLLKLHLKLSLGPRGTRASG